MKKKIILFFTISIFIMFGMSGCGRKSTKSDIKQHLKEYYPNESFEIVSREKIYNIKSSGSCSDNKSGYRYTIISNDTNVQFTVEDIYEASGYGTCYYSLYDNYAQAALEKYIADFNDSRISIYTGDPISFHGDIKIDSKDFKSIDEISSVLYNFKTYYESKQPFIGEQPFIKESSIDAFIWNSENFVSSISLSYFPREITLDSINQEITSLFVEHNITLPA